MATFLNKKKADCTPEEWQQALAYRRAWRAANKDKVRKHEAARDEASRLANRRDRYAKKPDSVTRPGRSRKENLTPEQWARKLEMAKKHRQADSYKQKKRARERARDQDLRFRIARNMRARLRKAVAGRVKSGSAVRDLGCPVNQFKEHIESQFLPGMSWSNFNTSWHLDHIYPLSRTNLEDRAELRAVSNWRNYQPMWLVENSSKWAKVSPAARERFEVLANFQEVL